MQILDIIEKLEDKHNKNQAKLAEMRSKIKIYQIASHPDKLSLVETKRKKYLQHKKSEL